MFLKHTVEKSSCDGETPLGRSVGRLIFHCGGGGCAARRRRGGSGGGGGGGGRAPRGAVVEEVGCVAAADGTRPVRLWEGEVD